MIPRACILVFLIYTVQIIYSEHVDTEDVPVDLLNLKHVKINNLHGKLNEHMTKLFKNIETLELDNCTFKPMSQNFLNPLKNLRKLSIYNSDMEREVDNVQDCCKNLKEFTLMNSGLPSIAWKVIGSWPLEKLYFHHEKVPELSANLLHDSKLKDLTIEFSNIETIDEDAFSKLKNLETMNLQGNKIQKISKKMLEPLQNVKEICLKSNLLEKLTVEQFPSLPNLEKLNVAHNPIKEINLEGLKTLAPKLKTIDISGIDADLSKSGGINLIKNEII